MYQYESQPMSSRRELVGQWQDRKSLDLRHQKRVNKPNNSAKAHTSYFSLE